jgi:hypothetical protein
MVTLDYLRQKDYYKLNALLYDTVIDKYKSISKHDEGFQIDFIEEENVDYSSYEEFNFYNKKLDKILKSIQNIKSLDLNKKLDEGFLDLESNTRKLLAESAIFSNNIKNYRSEVTKVEKTIFKSGLLHDFGKLQIEISDLKRNLPKLSTPKIIESFKVSKEMSASYEEEIRTGSPKEFKRPPIVNGFVFPIHINDNSCVLYTGRIVGPLMGHGTKEEWSFDGVKWEKKDSWITWNS